MNFVLTSSMTKEKLQQDCQILLKFMQLYCDEKHKELPKNEKDFEILFQGEFVDKLKLNLCETCEENFIYSYQRLQNCPHEIKPRCRNCKNPCYEKTKWKTLAKIMRYSGIRLGLVKLKSIFKKSE